MDKKQIEKELETWKGVNRILEKKYRTMLRECKVDQVGVAVKQEEKATEQVKKKKNVSSAKSSKKSSKK